MNQMTSHNWSISPYSPKSKRLTPQTESNVRCARQNATRDDEKRRKRARTGWGALGLLSRVVVVAHDGLLDELDE